MTEEQTQIQELQEALATSGLPETSDPAAMAAELVAAEARFRRRAPIELGQRLAPLDESQDPLQGFDMKLEGIEMPVAAVKVYLDEKPVLAFSLGLSPALIARGLAFAEPDQVTLTYNTSEDPDTQEFAPLMELVLVPGTLKFAGLVVTAGRFVAEAMFTAELASYRLLVGPQAA